MKTQTKYEEIILNEIRTLPIPVLPQALKILRSLKKGVQSVARNQPSGNTGKTGLCGLWQDERSAEEIIADIKAHRSGYGRRKVEL